MVILALGLLTNLLKLKLVWALMLAAASCELAPRRVTAFLITALTGAVLMGYLKRLELETDGFPPESGRQLATGAAVFLLMTIAWLVARAVRIGASTLRR